MIGQGSALIQCEKCDKILGVYYDADNGALALGSCYCIDCHNKDALEDSKEVNK
jgi:hypothetical protein